MRAFHAKILIMSAVGLAFPDVAYSAESYLRYGLGVGNSSSAKLFSLGYSDRLVSAKALSFLVWQGEAGGWGDGAGRGRTGSAYVSLGMGLKVHAGPFVAYSIHGLGAITAPDAYLGSVPQFFHDIGAGLIDEDTGASIAISYKHVSNSSLFSPINVGRDFMTVKLGIPL